MRKWATINIFKMEEELDMREYDRLTDKLNNTYPHLMAVAAAEAVNFSKARFQKGIDIHDKPFTPRKSRGKKNKDTGRAILVKSGTLKRDIKVISQSETKAEIGTTQTTAPYAKAHNEGFSGTVTVPAHTRIRTRKVKETYTDRQGRSRTRTSKQPAGGAIQVRTYEKKMDLPQRQFLGTSAILDGRIETAVGGKIIHVINNF